MAEQLISTTVHEKLPDSYVRAEAERPRLDEVVADATIPVVDLAHPDRAEVVSQIGAACRSHGFFQVLNHGLPVELMLAAMAVAQDFFRLSPEEKAKLYSDDPAKKMRLSTSFNVRKETVHNWRDYLRLHCHPLEQFVPDWPANPPPFRDVMSEYCKEVRDLGFRLYAAISESLGLEGDYIKKMLGEQEQHMAVNFYPKCPSPELTYGLPAHTDPNALTILLMDEQVAGLQVLKEGKWIAVNPRPNALVINLGDQLQALSNGRYKSVWHRAVVNSDRARMSIASFLCPCNSVTLGPAKKLIGEETPAVYRNYTYGDAAVEGSPRRQVLVAGAAAAAALVSRPCPAAFAEGTKGFLPVIDRKAGYSFVYPFGWQEVSVQGQDKVYKDVIEPLESVSINMIKTTKEDIRDLGPPDQVAEALVRKVLAPPTQKTKLIEAKQTDIDGRAYYTFEFTAQAPNFTRHALGTITIANGKFYTLATGANERRWDKMKDRLHTIVDSFKIETKV